VNGGGILIILCTQPRNTRAVVASPLEKRGFGKAKTLSLRFLIKELNYE
jgi:hypothetical protein